MILAANVALFEGGGALPEDTSREGCGVGTPEICNAGPRQLGRLGGDQKNHCTLREACLLAAPGTAISSRRMGPAYALF